MENKNKLQGKIKGALTYPIILLVIIVAVVVLMMLVLVPAMSDIYSEFGGELPTITKVMVSLSNFFINYWWVLLIAILGIVIGIKVWIGYSEWEKK